MHVFLPQRNNCLDAQQKLFRKMFMQEYSGGGLGSLKEESIACAADKGGSSDGHEIGIQYGAI